MKQKVCCKGTLGRKCTCAHPAGDDDNDDDNEDNDDDDDDDDDNEDNNDDDNGDDNEDNDGDDDDVTEEVGRECTCAHPGEGEPTGGELDDRPRKCPKNALEKIACQNSMDSARKCHRFASLLGFDVM